MNYIVFHHDNERPYVDRRVVECIANKCSELFPLPPYYPAEAPTNYHVNRSIKNWQVNKVYFDLDNLVADVKSWIASKNPEFLTVELTIYQLNEKQLLK